MAHINAYAEEFVMETHRKASVGVGNSQFVVVVDTPDEVDIFSYPGLYGPYTMIDRSGNKLTSDAARALPNQAESHEEEEKSKENVESPHSEEEEKSASAAKSRRTPRKAFASVPHAAIRKSSRARMAPAKFKARF